MYHNLWQCSRLSPYLSAWFEFLREECNLVDIITAENYLFGFVGSGRDGLNHILLELKKYTFYNLRENVEVSAFCERFQTTLQHLMIQEKN